MLRRPALAWFVFSFLVFNANLRTMTAGDCVPATLLPFSVILDHQLNLDRFYPLYVEQHGDDPGALFMFRSTTRHTYSAYPIGLPLLLVPFYLPVLAGLRVYEWPVAMQAALAFSMEKVVASLIAAASVSVFYSLVRRLTGRGAAFVLTLLFAFATPTWSVSSQALWQHGAGVLMILLCLLCLHRGEDAKRPWILAMLAGLCVGLALAIRPTNAAFGLAGGLYLLLARRNWRDFVAYGAPAAMIGTLVAGYNYHLFGDVRGYYSESFSGSLLSGLAGILFSPSRGLLIYAPYFVFVPVAIALWLWRQPLLCPPLMAACLVFSALQLLAVGSWPCWCGGHCWGPRLLTEMTPCLLLLLVPLFPLLQRSRLAAACFGITAAVGIFTQGVGTFWYVGGSWDDHPVPVMKAPERRWDWADNPIGRSLAAGFHRVPFQKIARRHPPAAGPVRVGWGRGFLEAERWDDLAWHWCAPEGELHFTNPSPEAVSVVLHMTLVSGQPRAARLVIESPLLADELEVDDRGTFLAEPLTIPPGTHAMRLRCDAAPFTANGDPRPLVFRVQNLRVEPHRWPRPGNDTASQRR